MTHLTKLSQIDSFSNSLAFLQSVLSTELGDCTIAVVNNLDLDGNHFQISNYCHPNSQPIYKEAGILKRSNDQRIFSGEFIVQWRNMSSPIHVYKKHCAELFQDDLQDYNSVLVLPILLDAKVERWVLILDAHNDSHSLDLSKLNLLVNFAVSSLARAEEKKKLQEITNWREQELSEISRLQHLLLPEENLSIPGIELAFKFKVYKEAGGDYFDVMSLSKDKLAPGPHKFGVMIADVTGHGPSAAVEAAMFDAILRTYKPEGNTGQPAQVIEYVNTHFFTRKNRGKFVTAIAMSYDPEIKTLCYACAGHPYGYIKRGDTLIRLDQGKDIPIGVLKEYQWSKHEIMLEHHDIIFVYTDVVLETRNAKQEEFGFDRLEKTLLDAEACPHCLVDDVENALTDFNESDELCDDLTLCAIQIFQ
ncbi:MAG: serine/threonine-protein phosphatase [Colwellia sp.]|nr:serine/threonine-protein phosphatase [Colwellia sp.]